MSQLINGGFSSIEQMTELVRKNNLGTPQNLNRNHSQNGKSFREVLESVKSNELVFTYLINIDVIYFNISSAY